MKGHRAPLRMSMRGFMEYVRRAWRGKCPGMSYLSPERAEMVVDLLATETTDRAAVSAGIAKREGASIRTKDLYLLCAKLGIIVPTEPWAQGAESSVTPNGDGTFDARFAGRDGFGIHVPSMRVIPGKAPSDASPIDFRIGVAGNRVRS